MIIVMEETAAEAQIAAVIDRLVRLGYDVHRSTGARHTLLGAVGGMVIDRGDIEALAGVRRVLRVSTPYKLASRAINPEGTRIQLNGIDIGGREIAIIAGPKMIESPEQIMAAGEAAAHGGACGLSGNAFMPHEVLHLAGEFEAGRLEWLREAARRFNLLAVSEAADASHIEPLARYVDIIRISGRAMQNASLLREAARSKRTILLERNQAATIEETLMAAEAILEEGNGRVIVCEAGIRTFDSEEAWTFDVMALARLRRLTHLPVAADAGIAAGRRDLAPVVAQTAVAGGADLVSLTLHPDPENALSGGGESLSPAEFESLMNRLRAIAAAVDRALAACQTRTPA